MPCLGKHRSLKMVLYSDLAREQRATPPAIFVRHLIILFLYTDSSPEQAEKRVSVRQHTVVISKAASSLLFTIMSVSHICDYNRHIAQYLERKQCHKCIVSW